MDIVTECLTDIGPPLPDTATCAESPEEAARAGGDTPACQVWMSSPAAFLAPILVWRVAALVSERARAAGYGSSSPVLLANYDRALCFWRTSQLSLLGMEPSLLATLPRWGTLHRGALYQQPTPERPTSGSDGGVSLYPTPQSRDYRSGDAPDSPRAKRKREQGWSPGLNDVVNWATSAARDWRSGKASLETMDRNSRPLNEQIETGMQAAGALNPAWVESLQGYPIGWTEVE